MERTISQQQDMPMEPYEAPCIEIIEMETEGIIADSSGKNGASGWGDGGSW